jgi:hypothetical protein
MSADSNNPSSSSFYYRQQQLVGDIQNNNIQLNPPIKKMRSFDTGTIYEACIQKKKKKKKKEKKKRKENKKLTCKIDSSDGGRTMPEDFEEGLGLLNNEARPQPRHNNNNNNFVPDYSFSSLNNNVYGADESTEMLEQPIINEGGKEIYSTERVEDLHQDDFRRSTMKEKQKKPPRKSFKETIKGLFSRGNGVTDGSPRIIHINNTELNNQQKFISNSVSTAKYNLFTFLPKFLYEEFSKSANVFFLFISGIQVSYSA